MTTAMDGIVNWRSDLTHPSWNVPLQQTQQLFPPQIGFTGINQVNVLPNQGSSPPQIGFTGLNQVNIQGSPSKFGQNLHQTPTSAFGNPSILVPSLLPPLTQTGLNFPPKLAPKLGNNQQIGNQSFIQTSPSQGPVFNNAHFINPVAGSLNHPSLGGIGRRPDNTMKNTDVLDYEAKGKQYLGTVKNWFKNEETGFIVCDEVDRDVFVHKKFLVDGHSKLQAGQQVKFQLLSLKGKKQARHVYVVQSKEQKEIYRGTVLQWIQERKFGFVSSPSFETKIFIMATEIQGSDFLIPQEKVEFCVNRDSQDRLQGHNVIPIDRVPSCIDNLTKSPSEVKQFLEITKDLAFGSRIYLRAGRLRELVVLGIKQDVPKQFIEKAFSAFGMVESTELHHQKRPGAGEKVATVKFADMDTAKLILGEYQKAGLDQEMVEFQTQEQQPTENISMKKFSETTLQYSYQNRGLWLKACKRYSHEKRNAKYKSEQCIYVMNINASVSDSQMAWCMGQLGHVLAIKLKPISSECQVAFVYFDSPEIVIDIIREYNSSGLSERKYIASRGRSGRRRGTNSLIRGRGRGHGTITPNFFSHLRGVGKLHHFTARGNAGLGTATTFQSFPHTAAAAAHHGQQMFAVQNINLGGLFPQTAGQMTSMTDKINKIQSYPPPNHNLNHNQINQIQSYPPPNHNLNRSHSSMLINHPVICDNHAYQN